MHIKHNTVKVHNNSQFNPMHKIVKKLYNFNPDSDMDFFKPWFNADADVIFPKNQYQIVQLRIICNSMTARTEA